MLDRLQTALDGRELRFMEVCGTHTVSIFQSGLRSLLPKEVTHLSGPGCPVCVTHDAEVAAFLDLAGRDGVIIATFGDLLRVPGPGGRSLKHAQAQGARIEIVYSPLDALNIAAANPGDTVVFLGIGFETTAPTVAATLMMAEQRKLDNFCVLSLHKLVPPVLRALLDDKDGCGVQAFLLPGHVSTILGLEPYGFLASESRVPAVSARMARLESSGTITGYQAQVDAPKLGYMVKAFINLDMDPQRKPEFYPYIQSCPHVVECNCVTGDYSMLIEVLFGTTQELDQFINHLQQFGRTRTQIVFSTPVEHRGVPVAEPEEKQ